MLNVRRIQIKPDVQDLGIKENNKCCVLSVLPPPSRHTLSSLWWLFDMTPPEHRQTLHHLNGPVFKTKQKKKSL